jgi:hypothetical protein
MSVEFELEGSRFRLRSLATIVRAWVALGDVPADARVELSENEDSVWVFAPDASIRGFTLRHATRLISTRLDLRINACASQGDWQLLYSCLRFLLGLGARGTEESGVPLCLPELSSAAAERRWRGDFSAGIGLLQNLTRTRGEEYVSLPNAFFAVSLDAAEIPDGRSDAELDAVHTRLLEKAGRYSQARSVSTIVMGDERTLFAWSGEACLTGATDFVAFPEENGEGGRFLPWQEVRVRAAAFIEEIRGRPPSFYFRARDESASDAELWRELMAAAAPLDHLSRS